MIATIGEKEDKGRLFRLEDMLLGKIDDAVNSGTIVSRTALEEKEKRGSEEDRRIEEESR